MREKLVLATRGSRLSGCQTAMVEERLRSFGFQSERMIVKTKGDRNRVRALDQIGGDGLFVREIEARVQSGEARLAVHSAKDLPYRLQEGLIIGGVIGGARANDLLIARKDAKELHVIGTGSARRRSELGRLFPDCTFQNLRGNVETRLQKLREGCFDAIVLAAAGVDRLGLSMDSFDVRCLPVSEVIPACGQGIIAIECREDDGPMRALLSSITDERELRRFEAERYLFGLMKADCSKAIAVHAEEVSGRLRLHAMFEGKRGVREGAPEDAGRLARELAGELYRPV
jgi:hydroxymethylbilane synthase